MPPDLVSWLIALALAVLLAFLYWAERRYPGLSKPREITEGFTFCAWCIWRDGETCTNEGSPVYGQSCGPVCIGRERWGVREVKR